MPRTYTLCPHHGSFHHTNTASGQAMSLHFYCFVKTHPGNPHTLGPRASLQETSSFHPAQAAERRGVLNEPQKCLWHLQYYPWDLRTHDPTTPVRLATEIWLKRGVLESSLKVFVHNRTEQKLSESEGPCAPCTLVYSHITWLQENPFLSGLQFPNQMRRLGKH